MKLMKYKLFVLLITVLSVMASCKKEVDSIHYSGDGVVVKLTGVSDGGEDLSKLASKDGLKEQTVRIPYDKDLSILATLTPVGGKNLPALNKIASTNVPSNSKDTVNASFVDGTKILALAYEKSSETLKESVIFTYESTKSGGDEILFTKLEVGKSYDIILLSHNTDVAPTTPNSATKLKDIILTGLSDDKDLLYFKNEIQVGAGRNTLPAKLKHVFSEVSMEISIDQVGATLVSTTSDGKNLEVLHVGSKLTAIDPPRISPAYETVDFKLENATFSSKKLHNLGKLFQRPALSQENNITYRIPSQRIIVANESVTVEIPSLTVNNTTNTLKLTGLTMKPGVRYKLKVEIGCPCTQLVNANAGTSTEGNFGVPWHHENATDAEAKTTSFTFKGSDFGAVLDIFRVDNSFNMVINSQQLMTGRRANNASATKYEYNEMEFQGWWAWPTQSTPPNVEFVDGTKWGVGSMPEIFEMNDNLEYGRTNGSSVNNFFEIVTRENSSTGTVTNAVRLADKQLEELKPIIKIVINKNGEVSLFGSKEVKGGEPFYPLKLSNGEISLPNANGIDAAAGSAITAWVEGSFNKVPWDSSSEANNTISVTQRMYDKTILVGRIVGHKLVSCSNLIN